MAGLVKSPSYQKKGTALFGSGSISAVSYGAGTAIPIFTNQINNDSTGIIKLSNTQVQLKAGKKYRLSGQLWADVASGNYVGQQFYNVTASLYIGLAGEFLSSTWAGGNQGGVTHAVAEISPTVDTTIEYRLRYLGANVIGVSSTSKCHIEEVEALLSETLGRTRFTEAVTFDKSITAGGIVNNNAISHKEYSVTSGTTIDVAGKTNITLGYLAPATITNFTNGVDGQIIILYFSTANAVTINRDNCYLSGSVNFVSSQHDIITLIKRGIYWYEISRSVNG